MYFYCQLLKLSVMKKRLNHRYCIDCAIVGTYCYSMPSVKLKELTKQEINNTLTAKVDFEGFGKYF